MKKRKAFIVLMLGFMLMQVGCVGRVGGRQNNNQEPKGNTEVTPTTDKENDVSVVSVKSERSKPKINIFIENSASMNGFINDASDFQNAMTSLTSLLKNAYGKENLGLSFINAKIVPQKGDDPFQVMNSMLVKKNFTSAGTTSSTDLNHLMRLVLDNTGENTLSFFVSDCIYSIKGTGATPTLLGKCKNGTRDVFFEKMNEVGEWSMLFMRMESNFNGGYWDYKHPSGKASQQLTDRNRPYYICVVGTDGNIKGFNGKINVEELDGFGQKYYLSGKDLSNTFYTVVSKPFNSGAFSVEDNAAITIRRDGGVGFAIAVNLDDFPLTEDEKLDPDTYSVEGNFTLERIVPIGKNLSTNLDEKKKVIDNGCTHYLVVSSQGRLGDFVIKVKRQAPQWVKAYSSDDDTEISNDNDEELKKTFGVSYFINGVSDAYRELSREKDCYFTMNIKIKHK